MNMNTYVSGGGGGYAHSTTNQASGSNDGPSLPVIGAVAVAGYVAYKSLFGGGM